MLLLKPLGDEVQFVRVLFKLDKLWGEHCLKESRQIICRKFNE